MNVHPALDRIAEVVVVHGPGDYGFGSGYLIGGGLVLTAQHVVECGEQATLKVRTRSVTVSASVAWQSREADLAVLKLDDGAAAAECELVVGRVQAEHASVLEVVAVGFPGFNSGEVQDSYQVEATVRTQTNIKSGLLELNREGRPRTVGGTSWAGFSGAAVFAHGLLVGVVVEVEGADVPLHAVPLAAVPGASGFWEVLDEAGVRVSHRVARRTARYAASVRLRLQAVDDFVPGAAVERRVAEFCGGEGSYEWWSGEPWSGKTTAALQIAVRPPEGVDVVSFSFSRSRQQQVDAFVHAVCDQLAALVGEPRQDRYDPADLADLWVRASELSDATGRKLLLLIDGLDEYASPTRLAAVVPLCTTSSSRILVLSRHDRHEDLADHPLGDRHRCPRMLLTPDRRAVDARRLAESDLADLLQDPLTRRVLATLAVAGPVSLDDLDEVLDDVDRVDLRRIVTRTAARVLEEDAASGSGRWVFGHAELHAAAMEQVGSKVTSERREAVHRWADRCAAAGWPADTPHYLLAIYPGTLHSGEHERIVALPSAGRVRLWRARTGHEGFALDEIDRALRLLARSEQPDLGRSINLALIYDQLLATVAAYPAEIALLWGLLGHWGRAHHLARCLADAEDRYEALWGLALLAERHGQEEFATALAAEAQQTAERHDVPEARLDALNRLDLETVPGLEHVLETGVEAAMALGEEQAAMRLRDAVMDAGARHGAQRDLDELPDLDGDDSWDQEMERGWGTVDLPDLLHELAAGTDTSTWTSTSVAQARHRRRRRDADESHAMWFGGRTPTDRRPFDHGLDLVLAAAAACAAVHLTDWAEWFLRHAELRVAGEEPRFTEEQLVALVGRAVADGDWSLARHVLAAMRDARADLVNGLTVPLTGLAGVPEASGDDQEQAIRLARGLAGWVGHTDRGIAAETTKARIARGYAKAGHWRQAARIASYLTLPSKFPVTVTHVAAAAAAAGRSDWAELLCNALRGTADHAFGLCEIARAVRPAQPDAAARLLTRAKTAVAAFPEGDDLTVPLLHLELARSLQCCGEDAEDALARAMPVLGDPTTAHDYLSAAVDVAGPARALARAQELADPAERLSALLTVADRSVEIGFPEHAHEALHAAQALMRHADTAQLARASVTAARAGDMKTARRSLKAAEKTLRKCGPLDSERISFIEAVAEIDEGRARELLSEVMRAVGDALHPALVDCLTLAIQLGDRGLFEHLAQRLPEPGLPAVLPDLADDAIKAGHGAWAVELLDRASEMVGILDERLGAELLTVLAPFADDPHSLLRQAAHLARTRHLDFAEPALHILRAAETALDLDDRDLARELLDAIALPTWSPLTLPDFFLEASPEMRRILGTDDHYYQIHNPEMYSRLLAAAARVAAGVGDTAAANDLLQDAKRYARDIASEVNRALALAEVHRTLQHLRQPADESAQALRRSIEDIDGFQHNDQVRGWIAARLTPLLPDLDLSSFTQPWQALSPGDAVGMLMHAPASLTVRDYELHMMSSPARRRREALEQLLDFWRHPEQAAPVLPAGGRLAWLNAQGGETTWHVWLTLMHQPSLVRDLGSF
ncbi:trypsin-like peptidase domain-containing protein [Streptomyces sp. NBC_01304]|uniref:trypsin-like peptidase domain-containing protein n=1 Tax=Streptomyces sp. NBC_01304 TaxID=2903818 RepID=UPI002E118F9E|nr:trypsin-like peptidase domain-containing protein [Streptomyces sp. NBC_01304]